MNMACSSSYSAIALERGTLADRAAMRGLIRWAVLGAAGVIALVLALSHSMTASAAAPCIQINYTTCVNYTYGAGYFNGTTYIGGNVAVAPSPSGYPANTVVSSYYDPRYGPVSVVTDATGNLIDVNSVTGQRIFPFYPDYGVGFVGANYFNGNFIGAPFINGNYFNGNYFNGNFINGNNCGWWGCNAAFPAGGRVVGGVVYYNDNRFCGDGKIGFVPGRGYFCQNGGVLGNSFYRFLEVTDPAPAVAPTTVTTVTAAPAAAAPAVTQTQVVSAPVATTPVVAPTAGVATALGAPSVVPDSNVGVQTFAAPPPAAPVKVIENDRD